MSRAMRRHPEQGSVTIVVAALWMGLFGMAALAVDAGHMYLTKRNLQDAADAAVMAGLPSLGTSATTAQTNARNMAIKCGYPGGNITATAVAGTPSTLTVTITASEPFFFAKVLGYSSKTVSATAVGQAASSVPAVFAATPSCANGSTVTGMQFNGGPITVTGDVESNGSLNAYGSATVSGSQTYNPSCSSTFGGASATGGSLPYPYSYTAASFTCTYSQAQFDFGSMGFWWQTGGPGSGGQLAPGVYCATSGNINVNAGGLVTGNVTLVAAGKIVIGTPSSNLTAFQHGILAYTAYASDCYTNQAVNVGNGSVTLNGSIDAPNGCVNVSGTTVDINGSLVGNEVQMGVGMASTINAAGGGGAGYWMFQ